MKESFYLRVPSNEHYELIMQIKFLERDGYNWIQISAIANGHKELAWFEWKKGRIVK